MNIKDEVKIMLFSKDMTLTELAKRMTEMSGKNYSQSLLSHKLSENSLRYTEMKMICKILGYRIYIDIDEIRLGSYNFLFYDIISIQGDYYDFKKRTCKKRINERYF